MRKKKLNPGTISDIQRAMDSEDLIGVVVFFKEGNSVVCLGDVAGTGIALQADTVYESMQSLETVARTLDRQLAEDFGSEVVAMGFSEEEAIAKTAAVESLRDFLGQRVASVTETPTALEVTLSSDLEYPGPWEWEGFAVRVRAKL